MELRQIRYFVAVAEEQNFGAAARRLHISQPPISRQIQQLEAELQVTLFNRTRKGVELTAAGTSFLEDARRILSDTKRASERTRAAHRGEIGQLEVAFFGSTVYRIVPELLRRFSAQVPEASISLKRMDKTRQADALREGRIHVGFGRFYPPEPDFTQVRVTNERIFLATAVPALAKRKKPLPLTDLAQRPLVLFPHRGRPSFADEVMAALKRAGIEPRVVDEAEDVTSALALTAMGRGSCLVPESVATLNWPDVHFIRLSGPVPDCPVQCIYRTEDPAPILQAFLDVLAKESADPG